MKNEQQDERIQKMLDQGKIPVHSANDAEVKAYKTLYRVLEQEPKLSIPMNFAEKVALRAAQHQHQKARVKARRQSVLNLGVIVLSLLISLFSLWYAYPPFIEYMISHKTIVGFAILMFAVIQLADHWLIRRRWHLRV